MLSGVPPHFSGPSSVCRVTSKTPSRRSNFTLRYLSAYWDSTLTGRPRGTHAILASGLQNSTHSRDHHLGALKIAHSRGPKRAHGHLPADDYLGSDSPQHLHQGHFAVAWNAAFMQRLVPIRFVAWRVERPVAKLNIVNQIWIDGRQRFRFSTACDVHGVDEQLEVG